MLHIKLKVTNLMSLYFQYLIPAENCSEHFLCKTILI